MCTPWPLSSSSFCIASCTWRWSNVVYHANAPQFRSRAMPNFHCRVNYKWDLVGATLCWTEQHQKSHLGTCYSKEPCPSAWWCSHSRAGNCWLRKAWYNIGRPQWVHLGLEQFFLDTVASLSTSPLPALLLIYIVALLYLLLSFLNPCHMRVLFC